VQGGDNGVITLEGSRRVFVISQSCESEPGAQTPTDSYVGLEYHSGGSRGHVLSVVRARPKLCFRQVRLCQKLTSKTPLLSMICFTFPEIAPGRGAYRPNPAEAFLSTPPGMWLPTGYPRLGVCAELSGSARKSADNTLSGDNTNYLIVSKVARSTDCLVCRCLLRRPASS
jgi:hypothetical protein